MESAKLVSIDPPETGRRVCVRAPARLHLGFLDPGGHLGRRFGSVGVAVEGISTEIQVTPARDLTLSGEEQDRVRRLLGRLKHALALSAAMHVHVSRRIPPHAGLGSGTQMALAVGIAVCRYWGKRISPREIARLCERGGRSGIGIAAFEQGGFIVDGGCGTATGTPPSLARHPVPEPWAWLLIFDTTYQGLHGRRETEAFRRLEPFPREKAAHLCHHLLIRGLPALVEGHYEGFCETLAEIQRANGEYFAPAQGGRYISPKVAAAQAWLERRGWVGLGQSSWGPTGFCLFPDAETAAGEMMALQKRFEGSRLRFQWVTTRNHGALIEA